MSIVSAILSEAQECSTTCQDLGLNGKPLCFCVRTRQISLRQAQARVQAETLSWSDSCRILDHLALQ